MLFASVDCRNAVVRADNGGYDLAVVVSDPVTETAIRCGSANGSGLSVAVQDQHFPSRIAVSRGREALDDLKFADNSRSCVHDIVSLSGLGVWSDGLQDSEAGKLVKAG